MVQEREGASPSESSPLGPPTSSSTSSTARSLGRRTLRTATTDVNPLSASDTPLGLSSSPTGGQYAVYSGAKKRASVLGSTFDPPPPAPVEPSPSAASPTPPSPSAPPTPPFAPTPQPSVPPLVSRASNSTLPTTSGRPYARSVSEAKELLQGQSLKAEVQSLGLGNESTGAAMVQKVALVGKETEWAGVMKALETGKITLLLPAEKLLPTMQITPAFFLDHLAVFESSPSASTEAPRGGFATLSGFRGTLGPDELVFASCSDSSRSLNLSSLPDYSDADVLKALCGPINPSQPSGDSFPFPSTMLISPPSNLSIPRSTPRSTSSSAPSTSSGTLGRASAGSRLAALFAKPAASSDSDLPPVVPAPPGLLSGDSGSSTPSSAPSPSPSTSSRSQAPNLEIPVLVVGKVVRHNELVKAIGKALEGQLRQSLKTIEGCDDSALQDRVCAFAGRFQPPSSWSSAEEISHAYQDLSDATRTDLNRTLRAQLIKERQQDGETGEVELGHVDYVLLEEKADAALDAVEEVVMTSLYDRMFAPAISGDAQEDENLASRIAALNMLELSLDHLGLDLSKGEVMNEWGEQSRTIRDSLEDIVGIVGKELTRLDDSSTRTPKAKLDIFVNLHKIVVEHLSSLPPIPLKKESADASTANAPPAEVEMDDASIRTGTSRTSSRPISPLVAQDDEALLRTPRPPMEGESSSPVPEIDLSGAELTSSVHEATSSSLFDPVAPPKPSPPASVFDSTSSRRNSTASAAPSSSSADLILPILIYAVVQYNPRFPSHLNYAQRFRAESLLRGESSYCSTNIHAVIEFLNTVLAYNSSNSATTASGSSTTRSRPSSISFGRKGAPGVSTPRSQDIDQFVDSANHALVRAADLLFGPKGFAPKTIEDVRNVLDGAGTVANKARGSLLRRTTNSSTMSPGAGASESLPREISVGGAQREMVDFVPGSGDAFDQGASSEYSAQREPEKDREDDARSVRSISSILRESKLGFGEKRTDGLGVVGEERPSLGDRLSSIPGLGRFGSENKAATISGSATPSQKTSLFAAFSPGSSPSSRRSTINSTSAAAPSSLPPASSSPVPSTFSFFGPSSTNSTSVQPVQRFMECEAEDLRLGEVAELLREYRKLALALATKEAGGDDSSVTAAP
ncbi:hypothetical protein BCR35DRAFT_308555 [Leucosporidium creatinivorum]|uniref:VPS9 domain-containing protein n=1 Tax=Leucosporidium creatinivorum TaxID=106004 RepID=A0A1Y2E430_9BASI|nr:hypothetical protein BCR35DRAFT_308555 [Leucosporidium creatinivorum]